MSAFRTSSLDVLPPEILSEVASHLDFIDILSLQQTSKKLRSSAEAHVVWLTLAKNYSARHFHPYRPGTGPFDDLKTDDLRAWIRRRLVVDEIWRAYHARPHFRTIHADFTELTAIKLVPGGRWLLAGCDDGSVCYYDLDSEGLKHALLTPPSSAVGGGASGSISDLELCVKEGASGLGFNLVVHQPDPGDGELGQLHVWQVKLKDDRNSLAAEWLKSIPYDDFLIVSLTLGRHLMARAMILPLYTSWIEITRWDQCSETRNIRTRFYTGKGYVNKIHLIGDDRLLCITKDGVVWLYTLPEPNHAGGYVALGLGHFPSREPIWSHSLSGGTYKGSSAVHYDGTTYRLVVNIGDSVWGLNFPATKCDDPSVVRLLNASQQWDTCVLGVCKAYTFHNKTGTCERIEYSWGEGGGAATIRCSEGRWKDAPPCRYPAFDEEVGRFVSLTASGIIVEDYFPEPNVTS